MIGAGWQNFIVDWLLNPDTHFGDVFTYQNSSGEFGEAMLALFETQSADSGVYKGGFYGVGRLRVGEQVYRSSIHSLNDDTPEAVSLEHAFAGNFNALPRKTGSDGRNYYGPVMYSDVRSVSREILGIGMAVGGVTATTVVGIGCLSNPIGWLACMGGGAGVGSMISTFGGFVLSGVPNAVNYPLLRVPSLIGNAPRISGWGQPRGYYQ